MNLTRVGTAGRSLRGGCVAVLVVLSAATGCTRVVEGSLRPAAGLAPRPLHRADIQKALLGEAELGRLFGQSFVTDPDLPPASGGPDLLQANVYAPPQCGGVADILIDDMYSGAQVRDVTRDDWLDSGDNPVVIAAHEAVVGLPTTAAAATHFDSLTRRWRACDGASTTIDGDANFTFRISHIDDRNSVLAADVDHVSDEVTIAGTRAVGVRANCIVEVDLIYYDRDKAGRQVPTAADVAHRIMDKVTTQS
jgi:hypothetical protein